jgi:hypothetical protein
MEGVSLYLFTSFPIWTTVSFNRLRTQSLSLYSNWHVLNLVSSSAQGTKWNTDRRMSHRYVISRNICAADWPTVDYRHYTTQRWQLWDVVLLHRNSGGKFIPGLIGVHFNDLWLMCLYKNMVRGRYSSWCFALTQATLSRRLQSSSSSTRSQRHLCIRCVYIYSWRLPWWLTVD